ncbi:MAG: glycosyltransferase [Bacteroidetes bacterium]|nr:glycosyltransferase [Bacteroidota bacterium]
MLSALYLVLVLYFLIGWLRLKLHEAGDSGEKQLPFVSIIIPVRNESENIQACLQSIFSQSYPKHLFEVIVIDDYSTDPTIRLAKEIAEKNLTVLNLQHYLGNPGEYIPNKKKAIALGIKNAKGELVVTTDGDCTAGPGWLRAMVEFFIHHQYKLVTGPILMKPALLPVEIFQQLDVISLSGITGATIRNGFPTMCNGANLMYAKSTFQEVEGFKGNHDVPTGDDIFLMQKINTHYENAIGYVKNREACVFTRPEKR